MDTSLIASPLAIFTCITVAGILVVEIVGAIRWRKERRQLVSLLKELWGNDYMGNRFKRYNQSWMKMDES
jgi:hypothetical protein